MPTGAVTMSEDQEIFTVNDVARLLRVDPRTVRNMIRDGELAAFMVRSEYRITKSALDALRLRDTGKRRAIHSDSSQEDDEEAG